MTDTANLGLPLIEASQAQKHVTHNEALRILDAAIQIAVLDRHRSVPPPSPAEGERHVVAAGAGGAWEGRVNAIATWQDGAWAFLVPKRGWCVWSIADDMVLVFDGAAWRDLRSLPTALDGLLRLGVNTVAAAPNLVSVKSNAALFAAIPAAAGGSGDVRVQLSKDSAANTASLVFSDAYSGRAEFGLVGSNAFKLKVSADGAAWTEAIAIDQASGNLALSRGVVVSGVCEPPPLGADQNDYQPAGLDRAAALHLSAGSARAISGLAGGADGRIVIVTNVGSQSIKLLNESAGSAAANRFALTNDLTLRGKQSAILRYNGAASRWMAIAGSDALLASNNLADLTNAASARTHLGLGSYATEAVGYKMVNLSGPAANLDLADASLLYINSEPGTTIHTVSNATVGKLYTLHFANGNTTINRNGCYLIGGTSITFAAGSTAEFICQSPGLLRQTRAATIAS